MRTVLIDSPDAESYVLFDPALYSLTAVRLLQGRWLISLQMWTNVESVWLDEVTK